MELDENLMAFLTKKRQSDNLLKDQIRILEVFDCILDDIKNIYYELIQDRVEDQDEFDYESMACGVNILDGTFFERSFLPSFLYYIYQSWVLVDVAQETLFKELFTVGTGSMTYDFFPEVTGLCEKCQDGKSMSTSDIRKMNKLIFVKQAANNFVIPNPDKLHEDSDDSDDENIYFNPFDSDDQVPSPTICVNPFDGSDSENEEVYFDACDVCCQSFPTAAFVELHKSIFHSGSILRTKFVGSPEPECLITSFIASTPAPSVDDLPASSVNKDVDMKDTDHVDEEKGSDSRKYNFRKRLYAN